MSDVTFVMLKPDAVSRNLVYTVMSYFEKNGIYAACFDLQTVTEEHIEAHYAEHIAKLGADFKRRTLNAFLGKLVVPIVLTGEGDVIARVRKIVGATEPAKAEKGTIRGDLGLGDSYAKSTSEDRIVFNLIHASDSPESVRRETGIWIPDYRFD